MRHANTFETSINLSGNDRRGNNCRIKEPKTLHATIFHFAQTHFPSIQRVMTFFFGDHHVHNTTMQEGVTFFFEHFHEHWPLVNSSVINAVLRLKKTANSWSKSSSALEVLDESGSVPDKSLATSCYKNFKRSQVSCK